MGWTPTWVIVSSGCYVNGLGKCLWKSSVWQDKVWCSGMSHGFTVSISNFREENIAIIREKFEEILYHLLPCQHAMDYSKSAVLFLLTFVYHSFKPNQVDYSKIIHEYSKISVVYFPTSSSPILSNQKSSEFTFFSKFRADGSGQVLF